MENSFELLQKLNWFLEPVSDFILFLFTTKSGYFLMLIFVVLYLIFTIGNKLRIRNLAIKGVSEGRRISIGELLYITGSEIVNIGLKLVSNVPVLLGILLFMTAVVGMSASFQTLETFFENQRKINQLETTLKHLSGESKIAKVIITDYTEPLNQSKLEVYYFNHQTKKYNPEPQKIEIKGKDIYFLAHVLNFEYSKIESGKNFNIAIPYKIFSDEVAQNNGIMLTPTDSLGIPYAFKRNENDIFGISADEYNSQILELAKFFETPETARKAGVRSFTGNFVHYPKQIFKGLEFEIWVQQTGGIVLKESKF